ncbi:MAG: hypothetical protein AAGE65_08520 [Planctomycetota bacterium]
MPPTPPTHPDLPADSSPDLTPDPALDALLDVALAPDRSAWSEAAREHTLAAMLDAARQPTRDTPPDVAGRIGPATTGRRFGVGLAAAAGFAIAGAVVAVSLMSTTINGPGETADRVALTPEIPDRGGDNPPDALALDDQLAAELDAWAAAARGSGLTGGNEILATASADWWDADPSADAYLGTIDADAIRLELDTFTDTTDLVF